MLNLIAKDFKLLFGLKGDKKSRIFSVVLSLALIALFIFLEIKIFSTILEKIKAYENAANSYFAIFLFAIAILLTFYCLIVAKKLFFNEADIATLGPYPISNGKKTVSKLLFLFIIMYAFNLLFSFPIFISYGISFNKMLFYFYTALYYPVLLFFFQAGVALILLMPYKMLLDFLKRHIFIQVVVVVLIGAGISLIYGNVLSLFVNMVSNSKFDALFTKDNLDNLYAVSKHLFPVNFLVNVFVYHKGIDLLKYIAVSSGIFIVGLALVIYFYNKFLYRQFSGESKSTKKIKKIKVESLMPSLIKKEFIILFRNSNYVLTFTGLLFIEPLLCYFVINSLNIIFKSGTLAYFAVAIPDIIIALDALIYFLLIAIVTSGGTNFIANENKNIRVIKTIPVSIKKQLGTKMAIPYVSGLFFSLLSLILLSSASQLSIFHGMAIFVLSIFYLLLLNLVSLYEELKIKRNGTRNYFYSSLVIYVVPIAIFFILMLLSYFKVNIYVSFLLSLILIVACLLPFFYKGKKRFNRWFLEMEVIN